MCCTRVRYASHCRVCQKRARIQSDFESQVFGHRVHSQPNTATVYECHELGLANSETKTSRMQCAHEKNVRMRTYSGVFCVQLLSPRQASFVPIISIETDLLHASQCRTCDPLRTKKKETSNFFLGLLRLRNRCKQVFICVRFVAATDTNMDTTLVLLGLVVICPCHCFRHKPCPCQRQTEVDFSRSTSSFSHDEVFRGVRTMVDDVNLCHFLLLVLGEVLDQTPAICAGISGCEQPLETWNRGKK